MRNVVITLMLSGLLVLAGLTTVAAQETDPIAILKSDASLKDKAAACRELAIKGDKKAVPALASMLTDEKLSHTARTALEPMPCPEAGAALRNALGKTSGRLKIGMISSLAIRKDAQCVPELIKLLSDNDAEIAQASAHALPSIAPADAATALGTALERADLPAGNLLVFCDSLLDCAEALIAAGTRDQGLAIYDRLLKNEKAASQVRAAALRGAILTRGVKDGLPLLVDAIRKPDKAQFEAALRIARELGGDQTVAAALAVELAALPAGKKIPLLDTLGECGAGCPACGPAMLAEAKDGPAEVRVAALRALTRTSYAPALEVITQLVWAEDETLAKAARNALSYFPGEDKKAALTGMLANRDAKARQVAIEMIGQGAMDNPADLLMKTAETDKDEGVRVAALKTLGDCAGIDKLPALLERLAKADSQAEAQAAENALASLCKRQERMSPGNVVIQKAVYGALPDGPSADVTEKAAQLVKAGTLSIDASNVNFGDTAPSVPKSLSVEYTDNGAAFSKTVREGETVKLTAPAVPAEVVDAFRAAFDGAKGDAKLALLRLLGATGSPNALETVRAAASAKNADVKDTALRALCEWPTPVALPAVMELIKTPPDDTIKMLALRGAVRLLKQSDASAADILAQYASLFQLASNPDEKKTVLGGLAQMPGPGALELALRQFGDAAVKPEALQAAIAIAKRLGKAVVEDTTFFNGTDLAGWTGDTKYWRFEDGALVGQSVEAPPKSEFLWSGVEVGDFYLACDVLLDPPTGNSGIQFRSKKIDEGGRARGYQADIGQDVWGRLYHEQGRGKLDWTDRADAAVKPGEWNHLEILAVGPAIWLAINGKLGAAFLDPEGGDERTGGIAIQLHAGIVETVRCKNLKLIHNPKIEIPGIKTEALISELKSPEKQ